MTDETRRRQKREELMAKAKQIKEDDRQSRLEILKRVREAHRDLRRPYSPEGFAVKLRNLFKSSKHTAITNRK